MKPNKVEFGINIFEAAKKKYIDSDDDAPKVADGYYDEDEYLYDSSRLILRN